MDSIRTLNLPETFEEIRNTLGDDYQRMSHFVVPIEEAERQLTLIAQSITYSGKIVLLLGIAGSGKSTFVQSLTWRKHLPIPKIIELDATDYVSRQSGLQLLFNKLRELTEVPSDSQVPGRLTTIVINYLENFANFSEVEVKAFFRDVNGLLRKRPLLIIWPMTERIEAEHLLEITSIVSGTVFSEPPILTFKGPPLEEFPRIVKNTISTVNPGLSYDDFLLTDDDLAGIQAELRVRSPRIV